MDDEEGGMKLKRMIYICDSMTQKELDSDGKMFVEQPTRMTRVARGSGTSVREVEELLTQQRMMAGVVRKGSRNLPEDLSHLLTAVLVDNRQRMRRTIWSVA